MTKSQIVKQLIELRDHLARQNKLEPYKILQFKTIDEIASKRPTTAKELLAVKGIGEKKLAQLGKQIFEIVGDEKDESNRRNDGSKGDRSNQGPEKSKDDKTATDQVFTVSDFLDQVNDLLGDQFDSVKVQGEISGLSNHSSGVYFTLKDKDDESVLDCYLPQWAYQGLGLILEDGMEVKAGGTPSIYKPRGKFSLVVDSIELTGEGSLKKAYELLKKKLEAEGLFARKRKLPEFVKKIGVITSRSGAVIDDFRNNLAQRGYQIHFHDVRVEGVRAVEDIMKAIRWFDKNKPDLDVLVVMRGGGSLEDLQAFNNELVARSLFASKIPTICGIGHDKDVPIASLVGDNLTSTPTAAAVLINDSWQRLEEKLPEQEQELLYNFERALQRQQVALGGLTEKLSSFFEQLFTKYKNLQQRLWDGLAKTLRQKDEIRGQTSELSVNLVEKFKLILTRINERLQEREKYLTSVSPERNLQLGYSIIRNRTGQVVRSVENVKIGETLVAQVRRGEIESRVEKVKNK